MDRHFWGNKGANLVVPILAGVPFIGVIAIAMLAVGANLRPGAGSAVIYLSVVAVVAAVPALARVTAAPWVLAGAVVVAWVGKSIIEGIAGIREAALNGEMGGYYGGSGTGGLVIVIVVAAGFSFWRRAAFSRPPNVSMILGWARQELWTYFRDTRTGPRRALIGGGLFIVAWVLVGLVMPDAHPEAEPLAAHLLFSGVGSALGITGGGILYTALRIPDEVPVDDEPPLSPAEPPPTAPTSTPMNARR